MIKTVIPYLIYVLGLSWMFATQESIGYLIIIVGISAMLFHRFELLETKKILELYVVGLTSSILYQLFTGFEWTLLGLTIMSLIIFISSHIQKGNLLLNSNKISASYYFEQLGLSLMLAIGVGVLLIFTMPNELAAFGVYALLYFAWLMWMKMTKTFHAYNFVLMGVHALSWLYIATFFSDISAVVKWTFFAIVLVAMATQLPKRKGVKL
jgi:hypothetical protein